MTYVLKIWYAASDEASPQEQTLTKEQVEEFVRPEVGFMHDMLSLEGAGVRRLTLEVERVDDGFRVGDEVEDREGDRSVIEKIEADGGRITTDRGWRYKPSDLTRVGEGT